MPAQIPAPPPDSIYLHGNILTGAGLPGGTAGGVAPALASALAVTGTKISAVGSDAQVLSLRGPRTEVIDLKGAFLMPGFNDAHVHMASAGQQKLSVDLDGTPSLADMQERIRVYTAAARPGQWILGAGWDHTKWASRTLPSRADLDKVTAGHPAVFYRTDGHIVVANSAALAAAGIAAGTTAPGGGQIDHDASGAPTGIVREAPAIAMIYAKVPPPDAETRRKALDVAIADALAHGVTSVQDFSAWEDFQVLEAMEKEGTLHLRVSEWLDFNTPVEVLKQRKASHAADDPLLHTGQLKGFMDGSLGSRTAALAAPYSDDPGNMGLLRYDTKALEAMTDERVSAGFDINFHAIGDRANEVALTALDKAIRTRMRLLGSLLPQLQKAAGAQITVTLTSRYRIEHAQVLLPGDFDRFAKVGVIASMQPSHLLTDMAWAGDRLGPERAKYAYAWRSMLDHHVRLAFGTDYPVESISPFRGLYSAVTRQNEAGTQTFHPEQRITLAEALGAYTQGSAYAEFREGTKGQLAPGFLADFVVLDRDLLRATPREILATRVLRTVVGGQTVFLAASQPLATPSPAISSGRLPAPED